MISQLVIFNTAGDVLNTWTPTGGRLELAVVNRFIQDVLVDEKSDEDRTYTSDNDVVKYVREQNVVFCATYSRLVGVKGVEGVLERVRRVFTSGGEIGEVMDQFEASNGPTAEEEVTTGPVVSATSAAVKKSKTKGKKGRTWGDDFGDDGDEDVKLDFSAAQAGDTSGVRSANVDQLLGSTKGYGKAKNGKFLISDLGEGVGAGAGANANADTPSTGVVGGLRKVWSQYVGSTEISAQDFKKVRAKLTEHLVKKNVSASVCDGLLDEIEGPVLAKRKGTFTSLDSVIREELASKLRRLLTPNTSTNLLSEIEAKKDPYVISVVGVNGVGKSTNLSKLAYWLLQNNLRVLVAACDTFRSGAVEQLRVHVNNLSGLSGGGIDLFELGYGGKDLVSKIARGAIQHAKDNNYDVVLMDTAGRRHNDTQLMAPLAAFARVAQPDKIIMVGEALVGSDAVLQAQNFNSAFGKGRTLDAFIVSKCDTVGEQLGSIVDLVYATKVPVLFVGVGQTYTDLRVLSVEWVISQLLS